MIEETANKERNPVLNSILKRISPADQEKTDDRMLVAARIEDLLREKGLSKKDFGERVDQRPPVISKWLSGTHNFTLDTLTEIRMALGVSMAELCEERKPAVVFRSAMAVTGLAPTVEPWFFHGTPPPMLDLGTIPSTLTTLTSGSIGVVDLLTVQRQGALPWMVLSSCKWSGNLNELRPVRVYAKDEDDQHLLKV